MEIVTKGEVVTFSPEIVQRRGFIRAKHITWPNFRNGLITFAAPTLLQVLFLVGVNASASYYTVRATEVQQGQWELSYSNDLETVYCFKNEATSDLVTEVRKLFTEEATISGSEQG